MIGRFLRSFWIALACVLAYGIASASAAPSYYLPPKLIKRAEPTVPVAGPGTVVVQVFVNPNGTFKVQRILRSTNKGDDAAAMDVAAHSTYRPAMRGGKPVAAFYDFTLRFAGGGTVSVAPERDATSATGVVQYERMIRAGNYSGAKAGLTQYLAAHPGDVAAETQLGVALTFLNDYENAVAAFDKAGTVPAAYRSVAAKAYGEFAVQALNAKNTAAGLSAAKKAVDLAPGLFTYNTLGAAEMASLQYDAAVKDLERARELAVSAHMDAKQRAVIDANLTAAYIGVGNIDRAKASAQEAATLDPSNGAPQNALARYYIDKAEASSGAGKSAEAAAIYERGAQDVPGMAVTLYTRAAFAYLKLAKPDAEKAKADADKALALDPNNAEANYAAGVALADQGKKKEALVYLNKADSLAKAGSNAALTAGVEAAIKQLDATK